MLPSVIVPVAVNCRATPSETVASTGVMTMAVNSAGVTVKLTDLLTAPEVTVMVVAPTLTVDASPRVAGASLTVATAALDDVHVEVPVTSPTLPSLKVPAAVNCCTRPSAAVAPFGVMAIDSSVGGATLRLVVAEIDPVAARIVALPAVRVLANPCAPVALLMVATPAAEELQMTIAVTSRVDPSANVPVAANWSVLFG